MVDMTNDDEVRPHTGRATGADASWAPVTRSSTYELVIDAIEDQIMTGALQAYGVLRSEVGSGHGAGTFVAAMPSAALERFLRLHVALSNFGRHEVIETRVLLEQASASLAAQRADADALAELERLLVVMDDPGVSREDFNDADTAFHVAIARGGGNALFSDMTGAIRNSLRAPIMESFTKVADWQTIATTLRAQHHGIFRAISEGRAEEAAELTAAHIRHAAGALPELNTD